MMTNLFSVFDPSTSLMNMQLNWLSTFIGLFMIPVAYWMLPNRLYFMWYSLLKTLHSEFKILLGPAAPTGSTLLFVTLFSIIVFNNFMGLMPYVFTSTSHLAMTLSLSLPLWLGFMLYGWINHTKHMFAHLVPQGTPAFLMPFMVLIETLSNIMRPGTLAVRLAANMIAGHLLLTLLASTGPSLSMTILSLLILSQILLLTLEAAVAVIQSYVFAVLSTLYAGEVN
uniref:ATP synthase F0 subunit 6 n=1 Tax=Neogonodactylus oerstedii TaxID=85128 RepID=UPI001EAC66A2|nr:ATP synthase F0 subunit 6 [Neogonodactylus oerstedii]UGW52195.1 ATP synthase F0 subunit 6 [Neogonodactylus oerstedii]